MLKVPLIRHVLLRMGGAFFCQEEQRACLNPFASGGVKKRKALLLAPTAVTMREIVHGDVKAGLQE